METADCCFDEESDADKWFLTNNFDVVCIEYVTISDNSISIFGFPLIDLIGYFTRPVLSSSLQIFASDLEKGPPKNYKLNNIWSKMVKVDCHDSLLPSSVFIPLIHTLKFSEKHFEFVVQK